MAELGLPVDLQHDAMGEPLAADCYYQWQPEAGFIRTARLSTAASWASRLGWSGQALLAIGQQQWHDDALRVAKQLSRSLLHPLLGHKPLVSRALVSPIISPHSARLS